jgi:hydrogenase/urease accessory protein HupE
MGQFNGGAYTERRTVRRDGGLTGQTIAIEGLSGTSTDVLVRIESLGGATQTERLSPTKTAFVVQTAPDAWEVAATYLRFGIEHILFGFDHLLFVLALVILVRDWRRVALTVTAFTIAHSITLAAAMLDVVNVPGPPVEASIALSIVLVAVEIVNARRGTPSVATRWPWLVAFCFGLLHGFGFAGAPGRGGVAASCDPHRAIVLQSGRGDWATGVRGYSFDIRLVVPARNRASTRACPSPANSQSARRDRGLRDRRSGSLLAD